MKRWYSPKEAAEELGYETPQAVYKLIRNGQLPAFQPGGFKGKVRIDGRSLSTFIRSHTINQQHLLPEE